jgi:hypothetical protein
MKRRSLTVRLGIYGIMIAILLIAILIKQHSIRRERAFHAVTTFSEWERDGIPVETLTVHKRDVPVFTKLTILAAEDHVSHAFVPRDVKEKLAPEQKVYAKPDTGSLLLGTVLSVSDEIDLNAGLFSADIKCVGKGMNGDKHMIVYANTATLKDVIYIPPDVAEVKKRKRVVYKVAEGRVSIVPVDYDYVDAEGAVIEHGVAEGDVLIVKGKAQIEEGDHVDIIKGSEQ